MADRNLVLSGVLFLAAVSSGCVGAGNSRARDSRDVPAASAQGLSDLRDDLGKRLEVETRSSLALLKEMPRSPESDAKSLQQIRRTLEDVRIYLDLSRTIQHMEAVSAAEGPTAQQSAAAEVAQSADVTAEDAIVKPGDPRLGPAARQ